ncbi:MAG: hypothetical protein ABIO05_02315 [Ferruginibacter sp.]
MNIPKQTAAWLPVAILFIIVYAASFVFKQQLQEMGFAVIVLRVANAVLLLLSLISFYIQEKGIMNANPHAFVRSVMSAMMLKMLVCVAVVFMYVYSSGGTYNKRSVFAALILYLIYLGVEVIAVMKLNKKTHA